MLTAVARAQPDVAPDVQPRWASTSLSVRGADLSGLALTLAPALTLSGRVAFEGAPPPEPARLGAIRVGLLEADGTRACCVPVIDGIAADGRPPAPAAVRQDGAFTVAGILPGRYLLTASVPDRPDGARWWLKSAITAGRDLLDDPIDVTAGTPSLRDVVLTFSNRQSELMGTLQTAAGLPASEFFVIVYPVEQRWWRPGARRVRVTRPASDGAYAVPALPPGDYFIAALTDVAPDEWNDPQFLARLQGASVRVSVKDGERTVQDLRIK